jgi:hypothetical protein
MILGTRWPHGCSQARGSLRSLGFAYSWLFDPKGRKDTKAVMPRRVATQVFFTIAAIARIFAASLMDAVTALLMGENTHRAWIGDGESSLRKRFPLKYSRRSSTSS